MIDLGSGDGRIPIAFAKQGIQATGIEYNPDLVKKSLENVKKEHLTNLVAIKEADFWETKIDTFDVIVVFGMQSIMNRLKVKIDNEAKKGAKVLSNVFQFHKLKLIKTKNDVHLYIVR